MYILSFLIFYSWSKWVSSTWILNLVITVNLIIWRPIMDWAPIHLCSNASAETNSQGTSPPHRIPCCLYSVLTALWKWLASRLPISLLVSAYSVILCTARSGAAWTYTSHGFILGLIYWYIWMGLVNSSTSDWESAVRVLDEFWHFRIIVIYNVVIACHRVQ